MAQMLAVVILTELKDTLKVRVNGSWFTVSPMCTKMLANFQTTGSITLPSVIHFFAVAR